MALPQATLRLTIGSNQLNQIVVPPPRSVPVSMAAAWLHEDTSSTRFVALVLVLVLLLWSCGPVATGALSCPVLFRPDLAPAPWFGLVP